MDIPSLPSELTYQWLTDALGVEVMGFELKPVGKGEGFLGTLVVVVPNYADPVAAKKACKPATFVAKFPPHPDEVPDLVAVLASHRIHEVECAYYKELSSQTTAPIPRAYYAGVDEESGTGVLLMEDLTAAGSPSDFVGGITPTQAKDAVVALARLHAAGCVSFGDIADGHYKGIFGLPSNPGRLEFLGNLMGTGMAAMRGSLGGKMDRETWHQLDDLANHLAEKTAEDFELAKTKDALSVVHGDLWSNNLLYATEEGGPKVSKACGSLVAVLDFQFAHVGNPLGDVTFLLLTSMAALDRRAHTDSLLQAYLTEAHRLNYLVHLKNTDVKSLYASALPAAVAQLVASWDVFLKYVCGPDGAILPDQEMSRQQAALVRRVVHALADGLGSGMHI